VAEGATVEKERNIWHTFQVANEERWSQMNLKQLYQWVKRSGKGWTSTTRHFQANVAHFSRGVVLARSGQLRKIAGCVRGQADSQRRRLQRFVGNEEPLEGFYTDWTRSVLQSVRANPVVLVVDETKLKDQWGVMVVGLAYEGRCIPLAWAVYGANDAAAYPEEGQVGLIVRLLRAVAAGLPAGRAVRVLADRGIGTSPALMRAIQALGWTFLFRVTRQSKVILADGRAVTFYDQVTQAGQHFHASGHVFKQRGRIPAHVRVLWGPQAKERWALVTNDPTLTGWEYAQRMWIEEAFRDLKSHGWHVEDVALPTPQRVARLWVLLVVAYTWMLLLGDALQQHGLLSPPKRRPDGAYGRRWSLFREGWNWFLRANPPLRL
jgi:hypothetical protein